MLGLLTLGSSYKPRLPVQFEKGSGFVRRSSPITAAGPYRNFTGFPFYGLEGPTLGCQTSYETLVNNTMRQVMHSPEDIPLSVYRTRSRDALLNLPYKRILASCQANDSMQNGCYGLIG